MMQCELCSFILSERMSITELLTRNEVATMLGFKQNTIAKWAMTGANLPVVKIGRAVRYRREDVEDLIKRSTTGASQGKNAESRRS
ncbi:MAG: helix-turn-helix domain-containing protein [Thermoguttaceae bacterium]